MHMEKKPCGLITDLLLIALLVHAIYCTPVKGNSLLISNINSTSFVVTFSPEPGVLKYHLTVSPRHEAVEISKIQDYTNGSEVSGLRPDTLYFVSIKAEFNGNRMGEDSERTVAHTLPSPPKLKLKTPLPTSVFVFFDAKNYAQVSQWTIQYREEGNDATLKTVVTDSGKQYYVHWLSELTANTRYEVRARASQLRGTLNVTETVVEFSNWENFTTARWSVYGRVDLTNISYTGDIGDQNSAGWNSSLEILQTLAYSSVSSDRISIILIENGGGKARVHYRIRVEDKTMPSATNYSLSGTQFDNSLINNGDIAHGTPYAYPEPPDKITLLYSSTTGGTCPKLVERYMIVTPEDQPAVEEHLNVALSSATTAAEDDGLVVRASGDHYNLLRDDGALGESISAVSRNIVLALTPRFLVKDCLKNQSSPAAMYSEFLYANSVSSIQVEYFYMDTTEATGSGLRLENVTYTSSKNWSHFFLTVPAVQKVIQYEILNGSDVLVALSEEDLDSSDTWKFPQINISAAVARNTSYNMVSRATFRKHDGSTYTVATTAFSVTPGGTQCDVCPFNAACTTRVRDGRASCEYLEGETTTERETTSAPTTAITTTTATTNTAITTKSVTTTVSTTQNINPPIISTSSTPDGTVTAKDQTGGHSDVLGITLGIVIPIVVILLLVLLYFIWKKKRSRSHDISCVTNKISLRPQQEKQHQEPSKAGTNEISLRPQEEKQHQEPSEAGTNEISLRPQEEKQHQEPSKAGTNEISLRPQQENQHQEPSKAGTNESSL